MKSVLTSLSFSFSISLYAFPGLPESAVLNVSESVLNCSVLALELTSFGVISFFAEAVESNSRNTVRITRIYPNTLFCMEWNENVGFIKFAFLRFFRYC